MEYIAHVPSPLGGITLASDGQALTGLWFDGQKYFAAGLDPVHQEKDLPIFQQTRCWLEQYFSRQCPSWRPALAPKGTPFQQAVWQILLDIPYGSKMTYGEIARRLAREQGFSPRAAQAVGGAVGHNPISLLIPCHRVVGADGRLTGYAGGLEKKQALLALEKENP